MSNFLKPGSITKLVSRSLLRPSPNIPYFGLYRTEGDVVMKDELLVSQRRFNYHPGANVHHIHDRGCNLLKADCDGIVMITREKAELDLEDPQMKAAYQQKHPDGIYKLTYNVLPLKMSQKFKLIDEV